MNDTELNQAVAYAAGWMYHDGWHSPTGEEPDCLPDFANSYDAILPLVKALKNGKESRFIHKLVMAIYPEQPDFECMYIFTQTAHQAMTATPRQLCEAYLAVGGADS